MTDSNIDKCTEHQFIHLLAATFKDLHIENSKNYKRWYCPHHTDCVSMCCDCHRIQIHWMTLNAKIGGFMNFWRFWAARHILWAICAEFNAGRSKQAAHEIFSIERRFQVSTFYVGSRKPAHKSIKARYPLKIVILPLLASRINIDDFERPWTSKITGFIVFFCNF